MTKRENNSGLSKAQLKELKEMFDMFDTDKSNSISVAELKQVRMRTITIIYYYLSVCIYIYRF